jgi:hypothetical protein
MTGFFIRVFQGRRWRLATTLVVLSFTGTTGVSAVQPQKPSGTNVCTEEEFMTNCQKKGYVKYCSWWWDKQRRMGGSCMR